MEQKIIIITLIGVLGLVSIVCLTYVYTTAIFEWGYSEGYNDGHEEGYETGYFYGEHESGFIDCTLPSIEKRMTVVLYNDTHYTYDKILKWKDLCAKFVND